MALGVKREKLPQVTFVWSFIQKYILGVNHVHE